MTIQFVIVPAIMFLIGSIPFSYIIVRIVTGKNIREIGSGNVGATNAFRAAGPVAGIVSMILDAAKAFVPVIFLKRFFPEPHVFAEPSDYYVICSAFIILGHMYSIFLRFKGGKGVAVSLGILLALFPKIIMIALFVFIAVLIFTHIVSVASVSAALTVVIQALMRNLGIGSRIFLVLLGIFIIIKHRANLRRFAKNEEKRLF